MKKMQLIFCRIISAVIILVLQIVSAKAQFSQPVPFVGTPSSDQNYIAIKTIKIPNIRNAQDITAAHTNFQINQSVTYYDGLGRVLQNVVTQGSPGSTDIITPVAYDIFGREAIKYQPYKAESGTNGSYRPAAMTEQLNYYQNPGTGIKSTANPFSVTIFEDSPLSRPIEQGFPGLSWQPVPGTPGGHTIKTDYQENTTSDAVKIWETTTNRGARSLTNYLPGKLYKSVGKNENWTNGKAGTTEIYNDKQGLVILKRVWETESKSLSTYYIYDDLKNLRYVLPPVINENGQKLNSFSEQDAVFNQFIYGYYYDGRKQVVEKKVPGKGWEYMVYNILGKVVMTQDANQREKVSKEWAFNKYDVKGRVVMTGTCVNLNSREFIQTAVNNQSANHLPLWELRDDNNQIGYNTGYTNRTYPTENINAYYTINYFDDYSFYGNTFGGTTGTAQIDGNKLKGLATGSFVYILGTGQRLLSVIYYDKYNQVLQTKGQNHLGGTDIVDNVWSFSGELVQSKRTHLKSSGAVPLVISTKYRYDHIGRKLASINQINGQPEIIISKTDYNDLGQQFRQNLHSTDSVNYLNNTNYSYNERGWLKDISSGEFSEKLIYEDGAIPQWNGNVAYQQWGASSSTPFTYTYNYDKLNRLVSGMSTGIAMSESLSYDMMGNIASLSRDNGQANQYRYQDGRLSSIDNITGLYNYDGNGNALKDGRTGVNLTYNIFNLPVTVTHPTTGLTVDYLYSGNGSKLRKTSSTSGTKDYCNGIQYQDGVIEFIQTEAGIARNNAGNYSYEYNLTDHLGNVRVTFTKDPSTGALKKIQEDNYYPFGLRKVATGGNNNYLYTGKELQNELGQYDYGARFYDPVIARWNVVDPLAEKYFDITPYGFAYNNPISNIDPNGMDVLVLRGSEAIEFARQLLNAVDKGGKESDDQKDRYKKLDNGDLQAPTLKTVEIEGKRKSAWQAYQDGIENGLTQEQIFNGPDGDRIKLFIDNYAKYAGWGTDNKLQQGVYEVATFYAYGEIGGAAISGLLNFAKSIFAARLAIVTELTVAAEASTIAEANVAVNTGYNMTSKAVRSALTDKVGKRGYSEVGYQFQKHFSRGGDWSGFIPEGAKLNPATFNKAGYNTFKEIWRAPGSFQKVGNFIEKRLSDGRGIRLQENWKFKGFLD